MIGRCPEQWADGTVRRMCAREGAGAADPFASLPVSSLATNRTYSNYYCAFCHADSQESVFWTPTVKCMTHLRYNRGWRPPSPYDPRPGPTEPFIMTGAFIWDNSGPGPTEPFIMTGAFIWDNSGPRPTEAFIMTGAFIWDNSGPGPTEPFIMTGAFIWDNLVRKDDGQWGVHMVNGNVTEFHTCTLVILPYPGVPTILCNDVANCAAIMPLIEESMCFAYDSYTNGSDINDYAEHCWSCALSPHIPFPPWPTMAWTPTYMLDMTDHTGSGVVGAISVCSRRQGWDPFSKRCRDVVCDIEGSQLIDGVCVTPVERSTYSTPPSLSQVSHSSFSACPKFYLNASEYEMTDNNTVYVAMYNRSFEIDEYELRDGELAICVLTEDLGKFDITEKTI